MHQQSPDEGPDPQLNNSSCLRAQSTFPPTLSPISVDVSVDVILVACRPDIQRERLWQRDGLATSEIQRHLNAQMPLADKRCLADFTIENDSTFADLERAVAQAWDAVVATSPARYIFLQTDPPESDRRSE